MQLESSPVEKIAIDCVIQGNPPAGYSAIEVQNQSTLESLKALSGMIEKVVTLLLDYKAGKWSVE